MPLFFAHDFGNLHPRSGGFMQLPLAAMAGELALGRLEKQLRQGTLACGPVVLPEFIGGLLGLSMLVPLVHSNSLFYAQSDP